MAWRILLKKAFITIVILVFLISGCTVDLDRNEVIENSETLNIGLSYPFFLDEEVQLSTGVDLAVKEINQNGGINGKMVNIIKIDDEGSVPGGMKAAQKFIDDESVVAVIAPFNSRVAISVSQIYNNAGLIMLTPGATSPYLMKPEYDYIFRTIPNEELVMKYMMNFIKDSGFDKVAVFYANDELGEGVADSIDKFSSELKIEVIDRTTDINDKNIKNVMNRWDAFDCEVLIIGELFDRAYEMVKVIKLYNPDIRIFGTSSFDYPRFIEYLGEYSEGAVIPTHYEFDSSRFEITEFKKAYVKEYGMEPGLFTAIAYDTVKILCEAISESDDYSAEEITKKLHEIVSYSGVTGKVSCDENGEFIGNNIFLKTVSKGEFRIIDYLYSPENEK